MPHSISDVSQTEYDAYLNARVTNIRAGVGARASVLYAQVVSETGELLVNATLEYCQATLAERQTKAACAKFVLPY